MMNLIDLVKDMGEDILLFEYVFGSLKFGILLLCDYVFNVVFVEYVSFGVLLE